MISTKHLSRFTGDKGATKLSLPMYVTQALQDLRFPGLRARRLEAGVEQYSGSYGSYLVDPPAGGFAAADTILSLPEQDPTLTIGAVVNPVYTAAYSPGIFDVEVRYHSAQPWTFSVVVVLSALKAIAGATDLGQGIAGVFWRCPGGGVTAMDTPHPRLRLLSWEPWKLLGSVQAGPMADTMVGVFRILVQPVVLFDENGNVVG